MIKLLCLLLLCVSAAAAEVRLIWDRNPESDIAGYRVYWGTTPRGPTPPAYSSTFSVGVDPGATVTGLVIGTEYFFAVTAFNIYGLESDYSNEISFTPHSRPSAPGGLTGEVLHVLFKGKTNLGLITPSAVVSAAPGTLINGTLSGPGWAINRSAIAGTAGTVTITGKATLPPFTSSLDIIKISYDPDVTSTSLFN